MKSVKEQKPTHLCVVGESSDDFRPSQFQHTLQTGRVQREERSSQFPRRLASRRIGHLLQRADQRLDTPVLLPELAAFPVHACSPLAFTGPCTPNIGAWRSCSSLPSPRYMWTPQGRHGSKLRTVRMMSMPLKL